MESNYLNTLGRTKKLILSTIEVTDTNYTLTLKEYATDFVQNGTAQEDDVNDTIIANIKTTPNTCTYTKTSEL